RTRIGARDRGDDARVLRSSPEARRYARSSRAGDVARVGSGSRHEARELTRRVGPAARGSEHLRVLSRLLIRAEQRLRYPREPRYPRRSADLNLSAPGDRVILMTRK